MKYTVPLLYALVAYGYIHASDNINDKEWQRIKNAVCKKMGLVWQLHFEQRYPKASEQGVRELAQELDFNRADISGETWDCTTGDLYIYANEHLIEGTQECACAHIICDVRQHIRKNIRNS
jgi:hypothetical protein